MIRCSFKDISKSGFIPLFGPLARPHLEYGMPACSPNLVADINHFKRNQRLAARLVTGIRHLPYEKRLQRRRLRTDLITAFKIFTCLLGTIRTPSHSTRPKRAPLQGTPRCGPPLKERVVIFGEGCEILEEAPGPCRYRSFCQCFQEMFGECFDKSLSPSPPLTEYSSPNSHTTPIPLVHHAFTVIISICYPTPCSIYVVSSGPFWPTFYH